MFHQLLGLVVFEGFSRIASYAVLVAGFTMLCISYSLKFCYAATIAA